MKSVTGIMVKNRVFEMMTVLVVSHTQICHTSSLLKCCDLQHLQAAQGSLTVHKTSKSSEPGKEISHSGGTCGMP